MKKKINAVMNTLICPLRGNGGDKFCDTKCAYNNVIAKGDKAEVYCKDYLITEVTKDES